MNPITVGIIGAGSAARLHTLAYQALGHTVKVAADVDPDLALNFCRDMGVEHYCQDYQDILYDKSIHAVSVCTPTNQHPPIVRNCLAAGKHVLLETPMARSAEEALALYESAQKSDRRLMLSFPNRFKTSSTVLSEFIKSQTLGSIYHLHAHHLHRRGLPSMDRWRTDLTQAGGGALMDMGSQILDLALYFLGFPRVHTVSGAVHSVFGPSSTNGSLNGDSEQGIKKSEPVEDYAKAFVRFENGTTLALEVSWAANHSDACELRILGTCSGAQLDFESEHLKIFGEQSGFITDSQPVIKPVNPHEEEINHFVTAIHENQTPTINTPEQGVMVQQIIDAIYTSSQTGREVVFS